MNSNKSFFNLFIVAIFLLILSTKTFCLGKAIFIGTEGNDNNSGLLPSSPLKSFSFAVSQLSPGDTLYILQGIYSGPLLLENINGLPDNQIIISGYSQIQDEYPVIDGGASEPTLTGNYLWLIIRNSSWLEVSKINFRNGWTDPISISNSNYISFNRCIFNGGRKVIAARGINTHHLLVENCFWDQGGNSLWTLVQDALNVPAWDSMHHGLLSYYNGSIIDFNGTSGSIIIRNNRIRNAFNGIRWSAAKNYDTNIEIYDNYISHIRDNDFEPENYTYNLHIYNNHSHNIHKTMSVDNVEGGNIYYYGNVITTDNDTWTVNICTGFWKVYGSTRVLTFPMFGFNNSFYGSGRAFGSMSGKAKEFKHFNNAYFFSSFRAWELNEWDATNEFDYDISNKNWASNIINNNQEKNGKIADIEYVDPPSYNLKLKSTSPGIDAGKIMNLPEFNWVQRFDGTAPDVGAYEGDKFIDGPAFRFRLPNNVTVPYKEKPRIVKHLINSTNFHIYFSERIDPQTVTQNIIDLKKNNNSVSILNISISSDGYELIIEINENLTNSEISYKFNSLPIGLNGERATLWGAKPLKEVPKILTSVRSKIVDNKPMSGNLLAYPNPSNNETIVLLDVNSPIEDEIKVYDVLGKEVATINSNAIVEGKYRFLINSKSLSSGIYFIIYRDNNYYLRQKFIVLK